MRLESDRSMGFRFLGALVGLLGMGLTERWIQKSKNGDSVITVGRNLVDEWAKIIKGLKRKK